MSVLKKLVIALASLDSAAAATSNADQTFGLVAVHDPSVVNLRSFSVYKGGLYLLEKNQNSFFEGTLHADGVFSLTKETSAYLSVQEDGSFAVGNQISEFVNENGYLSYKHSIDGTVCPEGPDWKLYHTSNCKDGVSVSLRLQNKAGLKVREIGTPKSPNLLVPLREKDPDAKVGNQYYGGVANKGPGDLSVTYVSVWVEPGQNCVPIFSIDKSYPSQVSGAHVMDIYSLGNSEKFEDYTTWNTRPRTGQRLGRIDGLTGKVTMSTPLNCTAGGAIQFVLAPPQDALSNIVWFQTPNAGIRLLVSR